MTSIPKYTRQDAENFFRDGTTPDELNCSIGLGMMRRPVRIASDTSQRLYDAKNALRALEVKPEDPFTRIPITRYPPLVEHAQRQQDILEFRDVVLSYARDAARHAGPQERVSAGAPFFRATPTASAEPFLEPPTIRQVAAFQAMHNAWLRRVATRPIEQPRLSRYYHGKAEQAARRAEQALFSHHARIRGVTAKAEEHAEEAVQKARQAQQATSAEAFDFGGADHGVGMQLRGWRISAERLSREFGPGMPKLILDLLSQPDSEAFAGLWTIAYLQNQEPSDILLSQDGAILNHLFADRAYDGLAEVASGLAPRTDATRGVLSFGSNVYVGEHRNGVPQGRGLMVDTTGGFYGGEWFGGRREGIGRMRHGETRQEGLWENGKLAQGIKTDATDVAIGSFSGVGNDGFGVVLRHTHPEDALAWSRAQDLAQGEEKHVGIRANGALRTGTITKGSGEKVTLISGSDRAQPTLGRIESRSHACRSYLGELSGDLPHGLGVLENWDGVRILSHWSRGAAQGPGAMELPHMLMFGTWQADGFQNEG